MQNTLPALQITVSLILLMAVLLPVVKNNYWIFRVFEYPRFQLWLVTAIVLASWAFTAVSSSLAGRITAIALLSGFVYLTYKIWPYTRLAARQMKSTKGMNDANQLRLYTANVYQENRDFNRMLHQIQQQSADLVLLLETDKLWKVNMDKLLKEYPYYVGQPQDNTYGMLLYSKLKIEREKIQFLVEKDIPSIEATVRLPSGQPVNIWCVHPKPPIPGEAMDANAKDKEIMKIAFKAEKSEHPVIVMGDFNDVAWSKVTKLFQKTSHLLDPRKGRGFYSTFSAHSLFVRFPLDYIFCSAEFGLIGMRRLPKNGSDHFAIFTQLEYQKELKNKQSAPTADKQEQKEAAEKVTA